MAKTETIGEAIAAVTREEWPRWKSGGQPVYVDLLPQMAAAPTWLQFWKRTNPVSIIDEGMPAHEVRLVLPGAATTVRIVNVGETDR